MNLLEVDNLFVNYEAIPAIRGISFTIQDNTINCIIGPNGAGKTTILKAIVGLQKVQCGRILLDGQEIRGTNYNLPAHKIVRMGIGYVPEGRALLTHMTVLENLFMGAYFRRKNIFVSNDIEQEFDRFPILRSRQRQLAGTLSGGEQQMLAISRALMARPRLLLSDEPSLGLAPMVKELIFNTIEKLKEKNKAVLLVEQDAIKALKISEQGYILELGQIKVSGPCNELIKQPEIKQIYLGT